MENTYKRGGKKETQHNDNILREKANEGESHRSNIAPLPGGGGGSGAGNQAGTGGHKGALLTLPPPQHSPASHDWQAPRRTCRLLLAGRRSSLRLLPPVTRKCGSHST